LLVSLAAALAIGATGWALWRNYQAGETAKASAIYDNLAKAAQAGDAKALRDSGGALTEGFPRTLYASMGALVSARFYFDRNDLKSAKAQLQWVIDRSPSDDLRELARLRLGGILLDEKAHDEALKIADTAHAAAYDAQYAALKGDVLVAKGQAAEAKAAYKLALDKAGKESAAFRESVRMRLEALGG
jgi:predicted negative regulator of RcsB-dependent stress response